MKAFTSALLATAIAVSAVAPAAAGDIAFKYKPYELQSPGAIAALYDRLEAKAKKACSTAGRQGLYAQKAETSCTNRLMVDLIAAIDSPALTAMHEATHGDRYASTS